MLNLKGDRARERTWGYSYARYIVPVPGYAHRVWVQLKLCVAVPVVEHVSCMLAPLVKPSEIAINYMKAVHRTNQLGGSLDVSSSL